MLHAADRQVNKHEFFRGLIDGHAVMMVAYWLIEPPKKEHLPFDIWKQKPSPAVFLSYSLQSDPDVAACFPAGSNPGNQSTRSAPLHAKCTKQNNNIV